MLVTFGTTELTSENSVESSQDPSWILPYAGRVAEAIGAWKWKEGFVKAVSTVSKYGQSGVGNFALSMSLERIAAAFRD